MMDDNLFERRLENFCKVVDVDDLTALNLAMVAESLDILIELQGKDAGAVVTQTRTGEWKEWDPEVYGVDEAAEGAYIRRLKEAPHPFVLLSEEAGKVDLTNGKQGKKIYGISDPFDGSWLYKRGLPFMQYSSLAFYDSDFNALTAVTGDVLNRVLAFANENGSFMAKLSDANFTDIKRLDEKYRTKTYGAPAASLDKSCIESYVLKPKKFLLPLIDEYRTVVESFKMLHPNGGPFAFAEAAAGQIDIYFARKQPYVDVFSGIQIAQQAGLVVSNFDGNKPPKPTEHHEMLFDILVSRTQVLHDQMLEKIAQSRRG